MNDSDSITLKTVKKKIKKFLPQRKCENAIIGLYAVLFLLVIVLTGTVIQEGKGSGKMVAWALFSLSLILGLIAIIIMIKGSKMKKYTFPIFSVLISIMNIVAMIMAKPQLPIKDILTPHLANASFAVVSIMAAVLTNTKMKPTNTNTDTTT